MLEQYEEVVEDWYFHHQDQRLENFLCQNHVLETSERGRRQPFVSLKQVSLTPPLTYVVSSPPLSECINEVWKGDMGTKGQAESENTDEEEGKTHDAGEL